ncbi:MULTISPECIES: glycoside hydrolase family 53 protein [Prevotellaceae]|uniref:glycoside hydrolase family 53 protein n=1 Tax=Prevotellaceae TaxID=171552 RepID=UPI0003D31642|nr:glycosyl hydrolase 53 family protein [Prevotella phocaeensis]ETD18234.1 hypothetical protein HMPREF1199_01043 [Hoylesella oralis CC98A]
MNNLIQRLLSVLVGIVFSISLQAQRYLGGDISLLPSYQKQGTHYLNEQGKPTEALQLFKDEGWNIMRVRLFVEPQNASDEHKSEGVCQDIPYVIALSKQIKEAGFHLMLDFHYSDTWADPNKQITPKRWERLTPAQLQDSVYAYTRHALQALCNAGIEPDFIQVGNEITFGMLWPTGRVKPDNDTNWATFSSFLNAGSRACREICPQAKLISHTEHAQSWADTKAFYDRMARFGVDYDIIGLSYYPMWHGTIPHLGTVLDSLQTAFPKPVMIVETAFYYSHDNDVWEKDANHYADLYPISAEGQRQFARELVAELNKHPNVTGLLWWFPEENGKNNSVIKSWINRGLFDNRTGKVLPAMKELEKFGTDSVCCDRHNLQKPEAQEYSAETLIIYYNDKKGKKSLLKAIRKSGAELIYDYNIINGVAIRKPQNMTIDAAIRYYRKLKGVLQVSRDRIMQLN